MNILGDFCNDSHQTHAHWEKEKAFLQSGGVTDSRKRRDGGWIESIGYYNPLSEPKDIKIDKERLNYWKGVGAKMSERVEKLSQKA